MTSLGTTPGGGWVPVPDPTTLTTLQLRRELDEQRKYLELEISALKELHTARFDAADQAVRAALAAAEAAVDKAQLADEKRFDAVSTLVADLQRQLTLMSAQIVPRPETDAWRQAMTDKYDVATARNADAIAALTARLDRGAGSDEGVIASRANERARSAQLIAVISTILVAVSVAITIIVATGG